MQTFMTQMSYSRTFADLDNQRLGKQRLEALQTLKQLIYGEGGYPNHPVNYMWRGYESALVIYGMFCCMEWSMKRGYDDKMFWEFASIARDMKADDVYYYESPPWFRDKDFLRSHRSNLIRKDPEQYQYTGTPLLMPYLWPVVDDEGGYELKVSKADKTRLAAGERKIPEEIAERVANL